MAPQDLPKSHRVRKCLAKNGEDKLSNQELLAVLFSPEESSHPVPEVAATLLTAFDGNLKDLFTATIHQLTKVKGVGFSEACKIKAAFELGKRAASSCKDTLVIKSTDDVVPLVLPHMVFLKQEQFRVILLDSKNKFIRNCIISIGSLDKALVEPREVFRPAIAHAAASLILVHNHPSGDPEPSKEDILLTQQLCLCGKILGIEVVDHVIIGISGYSSLKKRNLM
jgi:DNA repair protein RadC